MQPPRPRHRRERATTAQLLIAVVLNLGAAVTCCLLLGLVVTLVTPSASGVLGRLGRLSTATATPLERLAGLSGSLSALLVVVAFMVVWLAALGIVAGWEAESLEHPRFSHVRRP